MRSAVDFLKRPVVHLGAILALALVLRTVWVEDQDFWYDELQSVTMAALPLLDCVRSVKAFDPHPPLYYVQLHFWMLADKGESWINLNSVLWSLAGVGILFFAARRIFSDRMALFAALFLAISPFAIEQAQNVRMYAMMMAIVVVAWWFTHRYLSAGRKRWDVAGLLVATLAILYTHGAGFLALIALWTSALFMILREKEGRWKSILRYGIIQAIALAAYLPWMIRAKSVRVAHTAVPGFPDVIEILYHLYWAFTCPDQNPVWMVLGAVLITGVVFFALRNAGPRALAVAFVLVPLVLLFLISHLVRPIWIYRSVAFMTPFLCILLAHVADRLSQPAGGRLWNAVFVTLTLAFVCLAVPVASQRGDCNPYRPGLGSAASYITSHGERGDLVYTPVPKNFWALAWYLTGPGSFNPLHDRYDIMLDSGIRVVWKDTLLREEAEAYRGVWVVHRNPKYEIPSALGRRIDAVKFDSTYVEYRRLSE